MVYRFCLIVALLSMFFAMTAGAQGSPDLPGAGVTPASRFFFLDKLGETIREFLAFSPEAKARLNISFAGERVAEIKVILETREVDAKGLGVAQEHLQMNIARAASIVELEKAEGKDVSAFAKSIEDELEAKAEALERVFEEKEEALETQEEDIEKQIKAARRAGDTAQVEALKQQLSGIKAQKELLELEEEEAEEALEAEEERLEEQMEEEEEALEKEEERKEELEDEDDDEDNDKEEDELEEDDD